MSNDYFVMLTTQAGSFTPLMDSKYDTIAKFKTAEEAREAANNSVLGEMFGFVIFDIADGWS